MTFVHFVTRAFVNFSHFKFQVVITAGTGNILNIEVQVIIHRMFDTEKKEPLTMNGKCDWMYEIERRKEEKGKKNFGRVKVRLCVPLLT